MQGRGRFESRQQELSSISRALKILAKELNVPIIALSQLSRATETRSDHRPQLSDLRESGALEGIAEIIIGKQRNGPTGTARLAFLKQYTRFENLAPGQGQYERGDE
jgi:replicative DNA helicase